jgi:hypothetical protein
MPYSEYVAALKSNNLMSASQAATFASTYTVIDQYTDPVSGFSATVLDKGGTKYFAIRGTETSIFSGVQDWLTNVNGVGSDGIAIAQGIALFNYLQRLKGTAGSPVVQYVYNPLTHQVSTTTGTANGLLSGETAPMTVAGHSLGGHLAMMMSRLAPGMVSSTYTYNAPGFDTWIGRSAMALGSEGFFNALRAATIGPVTGQIGTSWSTAMTHWNVEGDVVHDIGNTPGTQQTIFSESAHQGVVVSHDIKAITDSLAVHALFAQLDPSLNSSGMGTITRILKASSNIAANSLEAALAAVGKIFGKTYSTVETDRDAFYINLFDLQTALSSTSAGLLTVVPLAGKAASEMFSQAQTDLAYRYALAHLNPFAITGEGGRDEFSGEAANDAWFNATASEHRLRKAA